MAKSFHYTWDDIVGYEELHPADVDMIRRLLSFFRANRQLGLRTFFLMALAPYYEPQYGGLQRDACFILYRLSDQVPQAVQRTLCVGRKNDSDWYTLEDWREAILNDYTNNGEESEIPVFKGTLPELPVA